MMCPMEDRNPKFMETENVPRLLVRFAAPAAVGMIANALYNIVDRIFVGQTVGADGLGSLALAFPFMLFFISLGLLVGTGTSSLISLSLGAKDQEGADRAFACGCVLMALCSLLYVLWGFAFLDPLLRLFGASEHLLPDARAYLEIIFAGTFFGGFAFFLNFCIRASGSPNVAMGTLLLGAGANVLLDACFVIGLGWGVRGAAFATILAQGVSLAWAAGFLFFGGTRLKLHARFLIPKPRLAGRILLIGMPSCILELCFALLMFLINRLAQSYGGDLAISAMGIFLSLDSLLFLPSIAAGEACRPIIGYNFGAGKPLRVIQTIKLTIVFVTLFYCLSMIVVLFFAEGLVKFFNADNAELIRLTALAIRVGYITMPLMSVSLVMSYAFQGMGKSRQALILSLVRHVFLLFLPLAILPRFLGLLGIWLIFPVSDVGSLFLGVFFMKREFRSLRSQGAGLGGERANQSLS